MNNPFKGLKIFYFGLTGIIAGVIALFAKDEISSTFGALVLTILGLIVFIIGFIFSAVGMFRHWRETFRGWKGKP